MSQLQKVIWGTILMFSLVGGCVQVAPRHSQPQYTYKWVEVSPPFDHSFIKIIAVVEFSNYSTNPAAGKVLADRIEQFLVDKSPYKVMSRMDLNHVLEEHNLSTQGFLSASTAQKIGKLAGLDALIVGNVENYDVQQTSWREKVGSRWSDRSMRYEPVYGTRYKKTATVAVTFKVINTTTGQVVWSKTSHGDYWRKGQASYISEKSDYEFFERALQDVLKDAFLLFPHREKRKVEVESSGLGDDSYSPPNPVIPSLSANVTGVKFFEKGYGKLPYKQRIYKKNFSKSTCRFINWELNLKFPKPGTRKDLKTDAIWYKPNGAVLYRQTASGYIEGDWTSCWQTRGWGWRTPGKWQPGTYRVELFMAGQKVASELFEITE